MLEILVSVVAVLLVWLFYTARKRHSFWKEAGVDFERPVPLFGSFFKTMIMKENQAALYSRIYHKHPGKPYVGFYEFTKPLLLVRDPDIIGRILVKDFLFFMDHGFGEFPKSEVDHSLFILNGDEWRAVRYKMAPTFTTGKLRNMFPEMVNCSKRLFKLIDDRPKDVDIMEVSTAYTMNVIASCAFGLEITAGQDSEFRKMGKLLFELPLSRFVQFIIASFIPAFLKIFNLSITQPEAAKYFGGIIKETFQHRKKNNVVRNDFVQMLLELKEKGSVAVEKKDTEDEYLKVDSVPTTENIEMTDEILISQAFTFLTAGFEGMTINIMYTLFELSQNIPLQERVREEVASVVEKHGGLTYDALKEATLLARCLDESLRKYPLSPTLFRVCTKRYHLAENVFVEPGTNVVVAVNGLHSDPDLFPDPDRFDPDRFLPEATVQPYSYLPFGDGPRMCIGMRFALLEIRLAIAVLLLNYRVTLSLKTKLPFVMEVKSFFSKPESAVYFDFEKITSDNTSI